MTKHSYKLNKVPERKQGDKITHVMDPIHNFIDISEYPVIQQLIDTPYFQRLKRLSQLGLTSSVYPNATHSRFAHSIGVMHVFLVLFDSIVQRSTLTKHAIDHLRPIGAVAALLHDIGHGPFSHISEKFLDNGSFDHESMTQKIILDTEIHDILKENKIESRIICDVLKHQVSGDLRFVSQLISSQLDADRIDYLMRDALFTGVPYGKIDIYRIANTMFLWDKTTSTKSLQGTVVISQKGIEAVENYLIGRYHMYKGVYYHKTVRCMESILVKTFKRASELKKECTHIMDLGKKVTPKTMLQLDDYVFYSAIHKWCNSSDKILKDLSSRIINRNLFKAHRLTKDNVIKSGLGKIADIKKHLKTKHFDPKYYFIVDSETKHGYEPYVATEQDNETSSISHIMVKTRSGELSEISQVSPLVRAISYDDENSISIFVPKISLPTVQELLKNTN